MFKNANIKDAVYLIDDDSLFGWGGLRTSWDYVGDGEGPDPVRSPEGFWLLNSDKDGEVYVKRDCVKFEGGLLTFEMLRDKLLNLFSLMDSNIILMLIINPSISTHYPT